MSRAGDYEHRSLAVTKRGGAFVHVMNQGWNKKHGNTIGMLYEISAVFRGYALRDGAKVRPAASHIETSHSCHSNRECCASCHPRELHAMCPSASGHHFTRRAVQKLSVSSS